MNCAKTNSHGLQIPGRMKLQHAILKGESKPCLRKLQGLPFEAAIIERYRRRESSVEEALFEMYLAGVPVRRVEDITETLWDRKKPMNMKHLVSACIRSDPVSPLFLFKSFRLLIFSDNRKPVLDFIIVSLRHSKAPLWSSILLHKGAFVIICFYRACSHSLCGLPGFFARFETETV